ncbi:MAG: prolyl aminopeptidase [Legionellales bacterium]|nr:prolyl aminopeptidase [Legionellales bacterium]
MYTLYPAIKTNAEHRLAVDPPHQLYVEECGNPNGVPVLVVHSGPGAGCETYYRRFFDPEQYRIILFDQRGAGRSIPHACLENNKTSNLLDDMETIREFLAIDQWVLFGGAWGASLSLLYAQRHPKRVTCLILYSVFLARHRDIDWFYQEGANYIFPDYWQDFIKGFSEPEQQNLIQVYHERLTGDDELARMAAAKNWSLWQARCRSLQPLHNIIDHFSDPRFAAGLAIIETHYFAHQCFIEENQILQNINRIKTLPIYIIHGRYNISCPLQSAWQLHQACPNSRLFIIRDAGHSAREAGITDAIILATKEVTKNHSTPA